MGRMYQDWVQITPRRGLSFSRTELLHLAMSVAALTLAFALVYYRRYTISGWTEAEEFLLFLGIAFAAVVTGFMLHELAHKAVAQRYGAWAEFRAYPFGLAIALMLSFVGVLFAAPGAVYIGGRIDRRQNGVISIAGPLTNLAIGGAALAACLATVHILAFALFTIATINFMLAAFNLLPIPPLDGSKVWKWNPAVYVAAFAVSVVIAGALMFGLLDPWLPPM